NLPVHFAVIAGPNTGANADTTTDATGAAMFTYTGSPTPGTDTIQATTVKCPLMTNTATKVWGEMPPEAHDLAITRLMAPKLVNLKAAGPALTKRVKVQIQNRSGHAEVIPSFEVMSSLVTVR